MLVRKIAVWLKQPLSPTPVRRQYEKGCMVLIRLESLFEIPSIIGMKKGFAVCGCANNQHKRDMGQELVCLYFDN